MMVIEPGWSNTTSEWDALPCPFASGLLRIHVPQHVRLIGRLEQHWLEWRGNCPSPTCVVAAIQSPRLHYRGRASAVEDRQCG